ncbi:MAG: hypothetical protein HY646_21050, partial [Acidobacteria bacterium]|nr:hypothetical protein [Acidobacteriota bacterium]
MFERYSLKAIRVVYYAREEVGRHGGTIIDSAHLVLGVLRESPELIERVLRPGDSLEAFRREVEAHAGKSETNPDTTVDLPMTSECEQIVLAATEEANFLSHATVEPAHLVLAILHQESSPAAQILRTHGIDRDAILRQGIEDSHEAAPVSVQGDVQDRLKKASEKWNVVIEDTYETPTSVLAFGTRVNRPVVLKVMRDIGDEWRCGEVLNAFDGKGMVRAYEFDEGEVLIERLRPAILLATLPLQARDEEATMILA